METSFLALPVCSLVKPPDLNDDLSSSDSKLIQKNPRTRVTFLYFLNWAIDRKSSQFTVTRFVFLA